MTWPDPADYQDAIQNPQVCFKDPELKKGSVGLTKMGLPRVAAGNFASVYEVKNGSGRWAVRCFLRQVSDQHRRYSLLSQHLAGFILPCVVGFDYIDQGILVRGQWYPIVKMEWVEGDSLTSYIKKNVNNPAELIKLSRRWRGLVNSLRGNHLAHGDLQHGNVLVTPQGELKLVDYDAMFVPSLRGERSPELGHANYQHPLREPDDYDEDLDNFSALVIYLSLQALAEDAGLWQLSTGENLILSAPDYKAPKHSTVLQRLKKNPNKIVSDLAIELEHCCTSSVEQVPVFEEVVSNIYAGSSGPLPPSKPPKPGKTVKKPTPKGPQPTPKGPQPAQAPAKPVPPGNRWWQAPPAPAPPAPGRSVLPPPPVAAPGTPQVVAPSKRAAKFNVMRIGGIAVAAAIALAIIWYIITPGTVDYSTLKQGGSMAAHSSAVRSIAFSEDGKTLASAGDDGKVRLWDVENQKAKSTGLSGSDVTVSVAFSSGGKSMATGGGGMRDGAPYGEVKVWELETGRVKWANAREHGDTVLAAAFSPDGKILATGSKDFKVILWDSEKGTLLRTLRGSSDPVTSLVFSPDGKTLASGSGNIKDEKRYGDVKAWDCQSGAIRWSRRDHTDIVNSVAFSPDGKIVASASDDLLIRMWDAASGQPRAMPLRGQTGSARWVGFSPDSKTVLGASADGTLRFWDAQTGQVKPPQRLDHGKPIASAAMSPNGKIIATGDKDGGLKLWFAN